MRAIRMRQPGKPSVLKIEDVAAPRPGPGEVLVEVYYAALNPVDAKIREGKFAGYTAPLPAILGRDIAGVVRSVGLGAGRRRPVFEEGTEVFGMLDYSRGAYAEYAVGSARELAVLPKGVAPRDAAALGVAGLTAWQGLFIHGKLRAGQRVLIHGGAGGVGHLAIQFAKTEGVWVATTARKADVAWVKKLGADQVVDFEKQKFEEAVEPVDVVFDLIGGETLQRSPAVLKKKGKLVSTREGPAMMVVEANPRQLGEIADLVARKQVRVAIAEEFPLERGREAHEWMQQGGSRGKLIFAVNPPGTVK